MHSNRYTLLFAVAVTVSASILLASAATFLKPRQDRNEALDIKQNILKSVGLLPADGLSPDAVEQVYADSLEMIRVDASGNITETGGRALYRRLSADGTLIAAAVPVSGKGLWSTIYGYLALEPDFNTVRWITFYKHGETPGLGGEIEKEWFSRNFADKKIFDESGRLAGILVAKGKATNAVSPDRLPYTVDGISGASLTGKGVTEFLRADLKYYAPYFKQRMKEVK